MMSLFPIGTRVIVDKIHAGKVIGYGTYESSGKTHQGYIVKLDRGFWNTEHTNFISATVAHTDNVKKEPNG
jgi:hypothetical protein